VEVMRMSIQGMREEFRGYRAQFVGHEVNVFDSRVRSLAHELADGEEVQPHHYLGAAREVVWERSAKKGPWKQGRKAA
jgi:hypothetical protein